MATRRQKLGLEQITDVQDEHASGGMTVLHAMPTSQHEEDMPDDGFEEEPQTPADRVMSMLSEIDSGDTRAYVRVSRQEEGTRTSWCKDYNVPDFERGGYEMVRRHWGPGDYQIALYGTQPGSKRFVIRTRALVQLNQPLSPIEGVPTPAPQQQATDLSAILLAMQESNRQAQEQLRTMMEAIASKPPPDPMAQMGVMFAMMKSMREAMGLDVKPANGVSDLIEGLGKIMELKEIINPPTPPESPMGMVTQMLPLLQTAMQNRAAQPQPGQPVALTRAPNPAPVATAPIAAPSQPTGPDDVKIAEMMTMRNNLQKLLQMGRENADVQEAADFVYEALPDEFLAALNDPKWIEHLKMIADPNLIEGIREWLEKVRSRVLWMVEFPDAMEAGETMPEGWHPATPGDSPVAVS